MTIPSGIVHCGGTVYPGSVVYCTTITLVVRHRTSGGRIPTVFSSEIIGVQEDDGEQRSPKSASLNAAICWLMENGYVPDGTAWLDPPGYLRRRKYTYRRQAVKQVAKAA